jgi:glycogen operon protein
MEQPDWYDDTLHAVGMFVSGDPLRSPGPRGEQQRDASFLMWFNADEQPVEVVLPDNDWVKRGEVVLSTDPDLAHGTGVAAGDRLTLGGLSVVVLRQS